VVTVPRSTMESFMKTGKLARQSEQVICLTAEGRISCSPPQVGHFKCIIRVMKPLFILLLIAGSLHAQSIADAARKERDRQANLKPVRVITSTESKAEEPKPAAAPDDQAKVGDAKETAAQPSSDSSKQADAAKSTATPKVDPVETWNKQVDQLRSKVRILQDQQLALQLQLNQANNQVYSTVTDQPTQERALALVAQIQNTIAEAGKQLDDAKKTLDAMLLQGPPKK
jgi:hypothetical protein